MQGLKLAAGAIVVLCAGCGLFPASPAPRATFLPREESDFSKSLAHFAHGIILEGELGRSGEAAALAAFRRAADFAATNSLLADLIVGRLWHQGNQEAALAEVQKRCRQMPSEELHALLAGLADAMGRDALAAEHFAEAAEYRSADAPRWRALQARAWIKAGRDRKALGVLQGLARPKRGAPSDFSLPFFWGQQLLRLKPDGTRARPYFELALQCATNARQRAVVYEGLAGVELKGGDTNAARRAVQRAARQDPSDPDPIRNLMRFEIATRGLMITNQWLQAAASDKPDLVAVMALAQFAATRRDFAAACRLCETARRGLVQAKVAPLAVEFYALYANLLDESGRTADAETLLREALDAHPDSALLQNHLAYFWAEQNVRIGEAVLLVKRALAQEPANGAFLDTLGWIYYRQGRYDEALVQLMLALRSEGDDPTVLDHIGDVCLALGRRVEALGFWQRSLRLNPEADDVADKIRRHADAELK
jgi:Tfp pilus assembly protein PilF